MVIMLRQPMDRAVHRPHPSEAEHRVVPFRPRGLRPFRSAVSLPPAVPDLQKYERAPEDAGEYRHRMLMNGLAFAVTVALIVSGVWIADVLAHLRKVQDCVLLGRTDCAPAIVQMH